MNAIDFLIKFFGNSYDTIGVFTTRVGGITVKIWHRSYVYNYNIKHDNASLWFERGEDVAKYFEMVKNGDPRALFAQLIDYAMDYRISFKNTKILLNGQELHRILKSFYLSVLYDIRHGAIHRAKGRIGVAVKYVREIAEKFKEDKKVVKWCRKILKLNNEGLIETLAIAYNIARR